MGNERNIGTEIQNDCVCFSVKLSRPSLRRKVRSSQIACDADKKVIHVSKEILESEAYEAITKLDGEIRTYLYSRCVPSLLRRGVYLLPLSLVTDVELTLSAYADTRKDLVANFANQYEKAREEAKESLRSLYNESDYPSVNNIKALFSLDYKMFSVNVPTALESVAKEAFDRERAKAESFWAETRESIAAVLRAEFKGLVDHLVERLTDDVGGKPKIFRDSLVKNFDQWSTLFDARNLGKDANLQELVAKSREILAGVDPDLLRDAGTIRESVRESFEQVKNTADKLVIDKPKRAFNFDED